MEYESRKKRRKKREKRRKIILSAIILFIIWNLLFSFINKTKKTELPESMLIEDGVHTEAIILKNENVYKLKGDFTKNQKNNEGKKIPVGYEIKDLSNLKKDKEILNKLSKIDEALDIKSIPKSDIDYVKQKNLEYKEESEIITRNIQKNINNYKKVKELKANFNEINKNIINLDSNNEYLKYDINSLNIKKKELEKYISQNSVAFETDVSGIISYKLDGYEDKLSSRTWNNYGVEQFDELIKNKDDSLKKSNSKGFKIIDNFKWYSAVRIRDINQFKDYKSGDLLTLSIPDRGLDATGKIIHINKNKEDAVFIIQFNSYLENIYDLRFPEVDLIKSRIEGYKIPLKSIKNNGGVKGVYIKEFNGIVRFKPVDIIKKDSKHAYISSGKNGYINIKNEDVRTVNEYDEIIVNPMNIKDGQILN